MIIYRKGAPLRIRRAAVPEPPFWAATTIAPYSARRAALSIDYLDFQASYAERREVSVCENVRDELERAETKHPLRAPVLIESTELAEVVFRRGEETLGYCAEQQSPALQLISTHGALPLQRHDSVMVAIAAWPLEFARLERLFVQAHSRALRWGVVVPVVYPVTTNPVAMSQLAALARDAGALFFAPFGVTVDPTAKQVMARSLSPDGEDETYATLFHSDLDPVHLEAERLICGIAAEHGLADFVIPPDWERKSNWNAAILLKLCASRMLAMEQDLDDATAITRSAAIVASLDKPLDRIAAAASLSIIEGVDPLSVTMLTEWLRDGRAEFAEEINDQWRIS